MKGLKVNGSTCIGDMGRNGGKLNGSSQFLSSPEDPTTLLPHSHALPPSHTFNPRTCDLPPAFVGLLGAG
jgi:hypothetical protein